MRWGARWAVIALVLSVACAPAADPVPSAVPVASGGKPAPSSPLPELPVHALSGYVIHDTSLSAGAIAADALDPAALLAVVTQAGFQVGIERRFTARTKPITEVVTRVLRFGSAEGARSYLAWIRGHGEDLLGTRTEVAGGPGIPGSVAFSHAVSGCCAKDTFQYFAAWTRGPYALTLRVGGPRAGIRTAAPLARAFDDHVRKEI